MVGIEEIFNRDVYLKARVIPFTINFEHYL